MAAKRSSEKASTKSAKRAPASKKPRVVRRSSAEKQRPPKPPMNFDDLVERAATVWARDGRTLEVTDRSPAQLRALAKKAKRASAREAKVRAAYEQKLAPLADARLIAHHEAWSALLDLYAAVRRARSAPEIRRAFQFLQETFATGPPRDEDEPAAS